MVLTYLVVGEEAKRGVRALKDQSELFSHSATLADGTVFYIEMKLISNGIVPLTFD